MSQKDKTRYLGIDLLRLIWLFAIIYFHTLETFFYNNDYVLSLGDSLFSFFQYPVRALTFSGFAIVSLSSFLLGWITMGKKKWATLMGVLALGALFLSWLEGDEQQMFYIQWDIYYFHFASFALIAVLQVRRWLLYGATVLTLPLLFFPVWSWDYLLNDYGYLKDLLLGDCSRQIGQGSWPLLPWIAIPLIMYSGAKWIQSHPNIKHAFLYPKKQEWMLWAVVLLASLPWIDGYFWTPIGPDFSCYVHRRPPIEFWSQWVWILFLMRLSFVRSVNDFLHRQKWLRPISNLQWSKNMGLAYALHFIFLNVGHNWTEQYRTHGLYLDAFFISLLVGVEISCRLLSALFSNLTSPRNTHGKY